MSYIFIASYVVKDAKRFGCIDGFSAFPYENTTTAQHRSPKYRNLDISLNNHEDTVDSLINIVQNIVAINNEYFLILKKLGRADGFFNSSTTTVNSPSPRPLMVRLTPHQPLEFAAGAATVKAKRRRAEALRAEAERLRSDASKSEAAGPAAIAKAAEAEAAAAEAAAVEAAGEAAAILPAAAAEAEAAVDEVAEMAGAP
nr:PREDICTED: uncharacterized protein LOC105270197 [Fopius arisanus]